ncbi:MAG: IS91 family transposase, partial [Candidatus Acidiferrales bacterium]
MKSINHPSTGNTNTEANRPGHAKADASPVPPSRLATSTAGPLAGIRTTVREYANPVDYKHPYDSMAKFADFLALRYDANRTRHAYYRQVRLMHEHFACEPVNITQVLPAELRGCFFGPLAKQAYDLFFAAASAALAEKLAVQKGLRAHVNGFVGCLHTWTQKLEFHPHIHFVVPGAGLDARGRFVRVKNPEFLVHLPNLQRAYRQHLYRLLKEHNWPVDPAVWSKDWGVHIQPSGSGATALKYLGAYVARTAINDSRIVCVTEDSVTFRWKDRSNHNRVEILTLPGVEFVRRYLRHVLPIGLRSVRYYGFCHPAAKAKRLRVQMHSGAAVQLGAASAPVFDPNRLGPPCCPKCGRPMRLLGRIHAPYR